MAKATPTRHSFRIYEKTTHDSADRCNHSTRHPFHRQQDQLIEFSGCGGGAKVQSHKLPAVAGSNLRNVFMFDPLIIYADGSYDPATQTGGWAFAVYETGQLIHSAHGNDAGLTNNTFEVLAVMNAVMWVHGHAQGRQVVLRTDSVHVVEGCRHWRAIWRGNGWKRINPNQRARKRQIADASLWKELDGFLLRHPTIEIEWCKAHSGIEGNEMVDRMARAAGKMLPP
ncbi:ribonuclease H [Agrobacterium sp.]|jgi:ribonuclease HI|uniref:ribonuclease H family protein n=1 Tax=Agrobacterium sp. TaxID=361 RepID=UPI0028A70671